MAAPRRRQSSSPGRSSFPGLLLVLVAAVVMGALLSTWIGNQSRRQPPTATGGAVTGPAPHTQNHQPEAPAAPEHETDTSRDEKPEPQAAEGRSSASAPSDKAGRSESEPARSGHRASHRVSSYPSEIARVNGAGMNVALTFDAGASPAPTPALLKALKSAGVRATFFLTGKWCEKNPDLVRQISSEGHEIANHTYSHQDLRKLSDEEIAAQLSRMDEIATRLTGHGTRPYFRPPFGGRDKRVLRAAAQEGYTSVYWAIDSWDAFKPGITSEEIRSRVLDRIEGGDVVLMHCGSQATADAVPSLITDLERRGYRIVTVSELARAASP